MSKHSIRELDSSTWPDLERVIEKHGGVWGGCWCVGFHFSNKAEERQWSGKHRELKQKLVKSNKTHSALVYEGKDVVGWCKFGPPLELPGRMSAYGRLGIDYPDWRIPCFFVDRDYRKAGVAKTALKGALQIIAAKGGGSVDAYPIDVRGKPYGSSFLWGGTTSMFEKEGFRGLGKLGTSKMIMRKTVSPRRSASRSPKKSSEAKAN